MSMIMIKGGVMHEYECLTATELYDVPVAKVPVQSCAFVYDTAKLYYLDTDSVWKEVGSAEAE